MNNWILIIALLCVRLAEWFWSFSPSERVALFSAFLVLIGVIGEEVVELKLFEDARWDALKKSIKRWAIRLLVVGLAGDALGIVMGKAEMAAITKTAGDAATSARNAAQDASQAKTDAKDAHGLAKSASEIAKPAKDTADKAKREADAANAEAGKAQTSAGTAISVAKDAQQKVTSVGQRADALTGQMTLATQQLSDTQGKLLDMATCLAPRVIPNESFVNSVTRREELSTLDPVRPFSGLQAIIDFSPDAEARRAAINIERALRAAGWTRVTRRSADDLKDGVRVIPWSLRFFMDPKVPMEEQRRNMTAEGLVTKAADAIVDWLHSFNWYVTIGQEPNPDIPSDAIEIKVGLYPPVELISSPGKKFFDEFDAEMQKTQEEAREKADRDLDERVEQQYKTYPPDMAARARAEWKQMRQEQEKVRKRYFSQPCRLINPFDPSLPIH